MVLPAAGCETMLALQPRPETSMEEKSSRATDAEQTSTEAACSWAFSWIVRLVLASKTCQRRRVTKEWKTYTESPWASIRCGSLSAARFFDPLTFLRNGCIRAAQVARSKEIFESLTMGGHCVAAKATRQRSTTELPSVKSE